MLKSMAHRAKFPQQLFAANAPDQGSGVAHHRNLSLRS
jgi:hypothetical protein